MGYESLHILLVDDNRHMRVLMREILRAIGVKRISEATDGSAGLNFLLAGQAVDLIITDLAMEPMDGLDFVKLLRTSPDSPGQRTPVIMVTGHSTAGRVAAARDAGITEFLAKPIVPRALLDRVHSALQHPRQFVQADQYTGPDRRRRAAYTLVDQRRSGARTQGGG